MNKNELRYKRAWKEIRTDAIRHNVKAIRAMLPAGGELMAVLKADAYGHGDKLVANVLHDEGVRSFAVSTLEEGMSLRTTGISGEILVTGYTHPDDADKLQIFRLTQSIVDEAHAIRLSRTGKKLNVHIKIDTGLHRLGVDYAKTQEILSICQMPGLRLSGMFTHLASADLLSKDEIRFTHQQLTRFFGVVEVLKSYGIHPGKLHVSASYGLLNFPMLSFDFSRIGILVYGVRNHQAKTAYSIDLIPVMSIRSRVERIIEIEPGEAVGYGRAFPVMQKMRVATVSIGFADGIPRQYATAGGEVIIRGKRVPIIGSIFMDHLTVDVSALPDVEVDDVVTLIGRDGQSRISAEEIAQKCETYTCEILSRMGNRLHSITVTQPSDALSIESNH